MTEGIFAIEGVAEAGKTTFVDRLEQKIFGVVQEIFDTVDVPRYDPNDSLQRLASDLWFLNAEKQRWHLAMKLRSAKRVSAVAMDRCAISQLVHMRARFDVYGQQTDKTALDEMRTSFGNGEIGIPSHIFVFEALFVPRTLSLDPYQARLFLARVEELYTTLNLYLNGGRDFSALRNSPPEELTHHLFDAIRFPAVPISLNALIDALDLMTCLQT
jgi:hypothetical protein